MPRGRKEYRIILSLVIVLGRAGMNAELRFIPRLDGNDFCYLTLSSETRYKGETGLTVVFRYT
jgi:hypothetical protein